MDQEKEEQIRKEGESEETVKEVKSQQNDIPGDIKEINVERYSEVAKLGQLLKDLNFPAPKSKILQYIRQTEDFQNKGFILKALNGLEKKSYYSVSDIAATAGLVK